MASRDVPGLSTTPALAPRLLICKQQPQVINHWFNIQCTLHRQISIAILRERKVNEAPHTLMLAAAGFAPY